MQASNNDLKRLENILQNIQANVSQANQILRSLIKGEVDSDPHRDVPGIEGTFDGVYMNTKDGKKIEVPVNYSAKSRLVYGDTLKMIKVKEEGQGEKTLFKQLVKVPRKRIEGVLSKKDGKWYLLTESNSYRILDRAAEFNGALPNDVAFGLIPEGSMVVPFASLDSIKVKAPSELAPRMAKAPVESAPRMAKAPVESAPRMAKAPVESASQVAKVAPAVPSPSSARKPTPIKPVVTRSPRLSSATSSTSKKEFISDLRSETKPTEKVSVVTSSMEEDDLR